MALPEKSTTWHFVFILSPARVSCMHRRGPSGIERRCLNFVLRGRLAEGWILAGVDVRIVAGDRFFQHVARHRLALKFVFNIGRQFRDRVCGKKESGARYDIWRLNSPLLPLHRLGVKDRPDRPASIDRVAGAREGGIEKIGRVVFDVGGVEITAGGSVLDRIEIIRAELSAWSRRKSADRPG